MPKVRPSYDGSKAKPAEGFSNYDGPTPPAGSYHTVVKVARFKTNKSGNEMLSILFEIKEPKGPKAKYNGYAIWWNGNLTEQGAPYVNAFAAALGLSAQAIWRGGIVIDRPEEGLAPNILKVGTKKLIGLEAGAKCARRMYNDEFQLNINTFFPIKASDDVAEEEDEEDVDDSFAEDDDESDDEEEFEEDEDEEPEPPKKRPAKKAAAKAPAKKVAAKRRPEPEPEDDDEEDDDDDDEEDDDSF